MRNFFFFMLFFLVVFFPGFVFAHQPRIVEGSEIQVGDPETSKAFYARLRGEPQAYRITSDKTFDLYVNILIPDIAGQQKDVIAVVEKDGAIVETLGGVDAEWKKFFEPFGHDRYFIGPEYRARVDAGEYIIRVSSDFNDSKYSLAIGEDELFNLRESIQTISIIPKLKREFFNKLPIDFILSPFGAGYVVVMFSFSFVVGFAYRAILKKVATVGSVRRVHQNIGARDRFLRVSIFAVLFLWAIFTSWSPILLFFAGFSLFEAIFSWCGFYAALGKNTCPIN